MIQDYLGKHTKDELQRLTKGFRFLRFIPPSAGPAGDADEASLALRGPVSEGLPKLKEELGRLMPRFPLLRLSFWKDELESDLVIVHVVDVVPWGDFTEAHFQQVLALEPELLAVAARLGWTPELMPHHATRAFDPNASYEVRDDDRRLFIHGREVARPTTRKLYSVIEVAGLVVCCEEEGEGAPNDNVYAFDQQGRLVWRIEPCPADQPTPYFSIGAYKGAIEANARGGYRVRVDPATGKILTVERVGKAGS